MPHALHLLLEPFGSPLLQRALLEVTLVGLASGVVGTFVILRGLSFVGESLAHTVLPGVAIAAAAGVSLLAGAGAFAALTVALVLLAGRDRAVASDTAIGVVLAGLFPLGVILLARQASPPRSLDELLFGDPLAIDRGDLAATVALAGAAVVLVLACYRPLLAASFDRGFAQTLGYRPGLLDVVLLGATSMTVVIGMLAVGNVLSLALLIAPAAAARLLTRRLPATLAAAAVLGAGAGVVALELSYRLGIAAGACIALCASAEFALALLARGLLALVSAAQPPSVGSPGSISPDS